MSDIVKQFTGKQTGGGFSIDGVEGEGDEYPYSSAVEAANAKAAENRGGRRRGKNSWLSHVKATMKMHRGKSFKQVLKLAKKSYKKSQSSSQSHSGGRRRKSKVSNKRRQRGGSSFAENAAAYPN
jgi:hypothetical protein